MHKGKSPSQLLKKEKSTRLKDYSSWFHKKQQSEKLIKSLQIQNQKLIAQNLSLQKENKELLTQKEKYFSLMTEGSYYQQKIDLKQRLQPNFDKTNSAKSVTETEQGSILKVRGIHSARKYQNWQTIDRSPKLSLFENELGQKFQSTMAVKRKRFNYLNDVDEIPIRATFASLSKTIQTKQSLNKLKNNQKPIQEKLMFLQQNQSKQKVNNTINKQAWENSQANLQRIQSLKKQLHQMRQIQSQLLDRIQQRDEIIENLKALIVSGHNDEAL